MKLNPFATANWVNLLRRTHQIKGVCRTVFGLNRQDENSDALRKIKAVGLKAAKVGQVGFTQDGTALQREFYHDMWRTAANEMGADFTAVDYTVWDVSYEGKRTRLNLYQTELDNPVALSIAGDKALCHRMLADGGIPVPDYLVFSPHEISAAHAFLRKHGGYFIVKPSGGTSAARGITMFVESTKDCTKAAAIASAYSKRILMERIVPGELYRLLVLRGKVIHAIRRPGMRILGDGILTIAQLVSRKLLELSPLSTQDPEPTLETDRDLLANLHAQDLDMRSILEKGTERIVKSYRSRMSKTIEENPAYSEDVTELIGEDVKDIATQAAQLIRTEFAAVELITPETRTPLQAGSGKIIDINTTPGLGPHFDLSIGPSAPNPAVAVLRCLLGVD